MARGGINKAVVHKARQSLLAKGVNPSIDAIRVELGNTGSKTTISRYLKEIESHDPRPMSSRERMSDELNTLVESLLDRLTEEGDECIAQASSEFESQRAGFAAQIVALQSELTSAQRQLATQQAAIEAQSADLQTTHSSLQSELTRNAGLSQRCSDLEVSVADKDKQVQSLEEKHVHARGALEHYRESVKEQRNQDQRRHESQLHELQLEQRKLRETLALKQDDLTRLNRDNERLLGETRQHGKKNAELTDTLQRLTGDLQITQLALARAEGAQASLKEQAVIYKQENAALQDTALKNVAAVTALQERVTALAVENETVRQSLKSSMAAEKANQLKPDVEPAAD